MANNNYSSSSLRNGEGEIEPLDLKEQVNLLSKPVEREPLKSEDDLDTPKLPEIATPEPTRKKEMIPKDDEDEEEQERREESSRTSSEESENTSSSNDETESDESYDEEGGDDHDDIEDSFEQQQPPLENNPFIERIV